MHTLNQKRISRTRNYSRATIEMLYKNCTGVKQKNYYTSRVKDVEGSGVNVTNYSKIKLSLKKIRF